MNPFQTPITDDPASDEDDSDDNYSVNEDGISLGLYNDLLSEATDSVAYVQAALSGDFGGNRGRATVDLRSSHRSVNFYHDIDSIGIYTTHIPLQRPFGRLMVNTTMTDIGSVLGKTHVGIQLGGEDEYTDIDTAPNYTFGKFGDIGRFTVAICFPNYTSASVTESSLHEVDGRDIGYFVDNVVLPSLHELYASLDMPQKNAYTPFSQSQEFLAHRVGNSRMGNSFNVLDSNLWPTLELIMRRRVNEIDESHGLLFDGFYFYSYCHGMKMPLNLPQALNSNPSIGVSLVRSLNMQLRSAFPDLDWQTIDPTGVLSYQTE
ncbi:hypothetical protein [Absidia glauca]|uniref:Uncharacterized protein n=1 Tax=Absidia glauca TaxID=4829 RepID=A0A168LJF9_ABSGL|nr:hypothetical protein [Absidia glauca]